MSTDMFLRFVTKKDYAAMLYTVLSHQAYMWYPGKSSALDMKAHSILKKLLCKKKYLFGDDSPLKEQPTRRGFQLLLDFGFVLPKYRKEFKLLKNGEKIPLLGEDSIYYV